MEEEERRQRLVNGELRRYSVRVVPKLCPACGARLRGFEEKRYHLNVLDDAAQATPGRPAATPSVAPTDPSPTPPPSIPATDPLYRAGSGASAHETDTRSRSQQTATQGEQPPSRNDVGGTMPPDDPADSGAPVTPVFLPPGSRLPSPQLWAAAAAQAAPDLERADRDGWVRAAALLAAEAPPAGEAGVTLVLGVPTEHARRRCAARAGAALAGALSLLLGRPVTLRPVITGRWLAERG
jgi:hypothetical protein